MDSGKLRSEIPLIYSLMRYGMEVCVLPSIKCTDFERESQGRIRDQRKDEGEICRPVWDYVSVCEARLERVEGPSGDA